VLTAYQFAGDAEAHRVPIAIRTPLQRQDLADLTGTTLETCIRLMIRWEKPGHRHDGGRRLRPSAIAGGSKASGAVDHMTPNDARHTARARRGLF
jgi:hypothetical protein